MSALDHLGFGDYRAQAEEVVKDCKSKKRRQSTRLENLGIPEEELFRQQQELFAKVSIYLILIIIWFYVNNIHFTLPGERAANGSRTTAMARTTSCRSTSCCQTKD